MSYVLSILFQLWNYQHVPERIMVIASSIPEKITVIQHPLNIGVGSTVASVNGMKSLSDMQQ